MAKTAPQLVVSIDVEEDSWGEFRSSPHTVSNVRHLLEFQKLCENYGVKPTYLITYPIATNEESSQIIKELFLGGQCEIGAHLHPWCTPPCRGLSSERNSMLCNIPVEQQRTKLVALTDAITALLGVSPSSFRAGRWAIGPELAPYLEESGYLVDSSICPVTDWSWCQGPDFSHLLRKDRWPSISTPLGCAKKCNVCEIPPTIGFLQRNEAQIGALYRFSRKPVLRKLRLIGILDRLRLINRVWLSPETSTGRQMVGLSQSVLENGDLILNMSFHSLSLDPGCGPFVSSAGERMEFLGRVCTVLEFALKMGAVPSTLTEAAGYKLREPAPAQQAKPRIAASTVDMPKQAVRVG